MALPPTLCIDAFILAILIASVEISTPIPLQFDNSLNKLESKFAKFNEILIRREANRDGSSSYYLNNTRCRRKDIREVFLGTGLGPRSYAIIEQGMISTKDLSSELLTVLKSKRDELVFRLKLTSKDEFEVLSKRVEKLENSINQLKEKKKEKN